MTTIQPPAGASPRTGDEIRTAVLAELSWAPGTGATTIGVDVTGGAVTLSGQVDSYRRERPEDRWLTRS